MTTLLYFHGYGSDRSSRKFINLKNYFSGVYKCYCVEWTIGSDISYLLKLAIQKCEHLSELVIVGDSTGANFAYQLRELRNQGNDQLVLLSPLLDVSQRKSKIPFPEGFAKHLIEIAHPENALIVACEKDTVLDQQALFERSDRNFTLLEVIDDHRLEKFQEYLPGIDEYLQTNRK